MVLGISGVNSILRTPCGPLPGRKPLSSLCGGASGCPTGITLVAAPRRALLQTG
jgi:hypothetical protein